MKMLTALEALESFGDTSALENVSKYWDESMSVYPKDGLFFLEEEFWRKQMEFLGPGPEWIEPLRRAAKAIAADQAMSQMAWHCYWRMFVGNPPLYVINWPEPQALGEQDKGLFYVFQGMNFWPLAQKYHDKYGIPHNIRWDTCHDFVGSCMKIYQDGHDGRPGLNQNQMWWSRLYTYTPLFRLGRLNFVIEPLHKQLNVYKNTKTGAVVAFPDPGIVFTADGYRLRDTENAPGNWTSVLEEVDGKLKGNPFSPKGYAMKQVTELDLSEWKLILKDGDPCLSMHIPAGGGMTPAKCLDSFKKAREFFATYFGDTPAKAIVCSSWIFNNQLQEILPSDANLVTFQREHYLFPCLSDADEGLWFVFLHNGKFDLTKVPRNTSLQKSIASFLDQGNRWRCGCSFYLMDDIEKFGTQPYISHPFL